jgi:hypothetical protein
VKNSIDTLRRALSTGAAVDGAVVGTTIPDINGHKLTMAATRMYIVPGRQMHEIDHGYFVGFTERLQCQKDGPCGSQSCFCGLKCIMRTSMRGWEEVIPVTCQNKVRDMETCREFSC